MSQEQDPVGIDRNVEVIAEGVKTALRREPVIVAMIIATLLALGATLWYTLEQNRLRGEFLRPLIEKCIEGRAASIE